MTMKISDPLYEHIDVLPHESNILDTPYIQRLGQVRQLGFTPFVYRTATHTRLSHSLGVMHLAGRFATELGLSDSQRRIYRLAGLLHDAGHAPYSHALENVFEDKLDVEHEDISCAIVDLLGENIEYQQKVKDAIKGNDDYGIVAGDVDADRLDYLRRDALTTGVPYGDVDVSTIIQFCQVNPTGEYPKMIFNEQARQAIESMFIARAHMTRSVYRHHTTRISEAMAERAVRLFLDGDDLYVPSPIIASGVDGGVERFIDATDCNSSSFNAMKLSLMDDSEFRMVLSQADGLAGDFWTMLTRRNLFKRAVYTDYNDFAYDVQSLSYGDREKLEQEIAMEAGVDPLNVIVDPPIGVAGGADTELFTSNGQKRLSDFSSIMGSLDDQLKDTDVGVYTPEEHTEVVATVAKEILGFEGS